MKNSEVKIKGVILTSCFYGKKKNGKTGHF